VSEDDGSAACGKNERKRQNVAEGSLALRFSFVTSPKPNLVHPANVGFTRIVIIVRDEPIFRFGAGNE
jgi:hypothetical protein